MRPPSLRRTTWDEPLFCHVPIGPPFDPSMIPTDGDDGDRWSRPGEPTAYLASDPGVALAELGRHQEPHDHRIASRIIGMWPRPGALGGLVDLRGPGAASALGLGDPATWWLDRDVARDVASSLRIEPRHHGIVVPSAAFPDEPARCNVILFADRLPGSLGDALLRWREVATLKGTEGS